MLNNVVPSLLSRLLYCSSADAVDYPILILLIVSIIIIAIIDSCAPFPLLTISYYCCDTIDLCRDEIRITVELNRINEF